MACVYLLGVIANYLQSRLMLEVAQSALVRIRTDLFTKMQKLPVRFYDTNSNGDLMSRFTNDVDTIGNMLSSTLVQLFSGTLSIIGTLFLMLYTNIWLTAVTLIMIPLMLRARRRGREAESEILQRPAVGSRCFKRIHRGDHHRTEGSKSLLP